MPVRVNELVMPGGGGSRFNTNVAEPVPPMLDARIVKETVPVTVGVPVIWPVIGSTLNPEGRPIAL